ncbi:MAG: CDP-diacylglycerol--glycerol-3-phosphate 3-phosphatidyltransferase [Alphaproteobacteria bacterium]|nr:CDP-diacylglycerol--glycerol-3-phosphate 3-phosphatidyltransferase [Alphaproteobacteria bacterium]
MKHIPNFLTILRIALIPALYATLYIDAAWGDWTAATIFLFAAATDFWDGWIARRFELQSSFGRMLDPIADKLIVATCLLLLVHQNIITDIHLVAAIVILCREILVSGLREYLGELRVAMPVSSLAKYKTAIQFFALMCLLTDKAGEAAYAYTPQIGLALLWIAAGLTMITGYDYLRKGLQHT